MAEKLAPEKRHSFTHNGEKIFEWDQTLEEHDLTSPVKTDSSFWTPEDDIMQITLQKRDIGQTWSSPIMGQGQLDPYTTDLEQKRLMLQRFQEENPGFDFSQAQFSGGCPDPRTWVVFVLLDELSLLQLYVCKLSNHHTWALRNPNNQYVWTLLESNFDRWKCAYSDYNLTLLVSSVFKLLCILISCCIK